MKKFLLEMMRMNQIDPKLAEQIFQELEALKDGDYLNFYYRGDGIASSDDKDKFTLLSLLLDDGRLIGKCMKGLGNINEAEIHVRLNDAGYELINLFRNR
ncbi:MAG: hypothetical protein RR633_20550 [Acinetobacter sp.]